MKSILITVVAVLVLFLLAGIGFAYSGIFNVAATSKDPALLSWLVETTREHSIESRSSEIVSPDPAKLNDPETLMDGFEHYDEMCVVCHGAPGIDAGEAREGLNPQPPLLAKLKDLETDSPGELFWVIKNGIKMTAMPAWGPTHNDEKIWAMTAFVKKLPSMSKEEYINMRQKIAAAGRTHEHNAESGHTHADDKAAPSHEHQHNEPHSH